MRTFRALLLVATVLLGTSRAQLVTLGATPGPQGGIAAGAATPTLSLASGAIAPGTSITGADSTTNATVYYTIDGSTPTYNSATYLPTGSTHILGLGTGGANTGTDGLPAGFTFVGSFAPYGPMTVKLLAAKSGLADSTVASYSYTLTAPTGTAMSACQTISAAGTYYLSADVTSSATCFPITASNVNLNLNGHTITFGTGGANQWTGTCNSTSGNATFTCPAASFTSAYVGSMFWINNYNLGGYQNIRATISAASGTSLTISAGTPGFTATGATAFISAAPAYAIACDQHLIGGTCSNVSIYNGTITQSASSSPQSDSIQDGALATWGVANGNWVISNLTLNNVGIETHAIIISYTAKGDTIQYNTLNDTSTQVYNRDLFAGYPVYIVGSYNGPATTPLESIHDNNVTASPQGGFLSEDSTTMTNNTCTLGPTEYVASYCGFAASTTNNMIGNNAYGVARGWEMEGSNEVLEANYTVMQDSGSVQDPNHNPTGCEIDGSRGARSKDYSTSTPSMLNNVISYNDFEMTAAACPGQGIGFTAAISGDSATVAHNLINIIATQSQTGANSPSADYQTDAAVMTGVTYSSNTALLSGTFASTAYNAYTYYDGVSGWTLPLPNNPTIYWTQGTTNSSMTLTGTGTATLTCSHGGTATLSATFNGVSLPCP